MTILEHSIYIDTSPDIVDAIASDPRSWPDWYADIEQIRIDPIFPEVGGQVEITFNIMAIKFKVRFTQIEFIPGQKSICQIEGRLHGKTRFMLEPKGNGTQATLTLQYKIPGGWLGGIASKYIVEEKAGENLETSLSNLKKLVESKQLQVDQSI